MGPKTSAKTITLELPDDLMSTLGTLDEVAARVRKALILDLLRDAHITQGEAAQLLGVTRYDILDLMALHHIPSGPMTAEEMERDIENARRFARTAATIDGSQH